MLIKVAVVGSKEEAWELIKLDGSCFFGSLGPFFLIYSLFFRMQSICFAFEICVQKTDMYVWPPIILIAKKASTAERHS